MAYGLLNQGNNSQYQTFNEANTGRYNEIMNGYNQMYQNQQQRAAGINQGYEGMIAGQKGIGQAQQTALEQNYARQGAAQQQSLISRGLGNSSIMADAQRATGYDQQNAQTNLNDQLQQRIIGIQGQQQGYAQQNAQQLQGIQGQQVGFMHSQMPGLTTNTQQSGYGLYNALQYPNKPPAPATGLITYAGAQGGHDPLQGTAFEGGTYYGMGGGNNYGYGK